MTDPRRRIPGVDGLLELEAFQALVRRFPRDRVVTHLRAIQDEVRGRLAREEEFLDPESPETYLEPLTRRLAADEIPSLRGVINATGVVLHTNLGRAPLAPVAREAMVAAATGYSNLEFDLEAGERGSRYAHCVDLLTELTGAEAALVVNNNAAALVLALNTAASDRYVLVSRGELIEIGGGFRIPDMLARAGTRLREVGTTNRTRPSDYEEALGEGDVGAILKVHRSNFRVAGFTEEATTGELAALADGAEVPLIHDLGSGLFLDPGLLGLPDEPMATASLRLGSHVVAVSGDKLLGGPQAGLLLGEEGWIEAMRRNPLCRALRVDKVTLAGLEATLALYRDPERARAEIPALRMLSDPVDQLRGRAEALAASLEQGGVPAESVAGLSVVGGGTYPGVELPTWTVRVAAPEGASLDERMLALRTGEPPVVGRVEDGCLVLDLRTVGSHEEAALARRVREAWGG